MKQSHSWEANRSADQEISRILRRPMSHHRTRKRSLPGPILYVPLFLCLRHTKGSV